MTTEKEKEQAHAPLPPSASDSWSVCTMWPDVVKDYDDEPGEDARKGTEAHHFLLEEAIPKKKHPVILDPKHESIRAVSIAYEHLALYLDNPNVMVLTEAPVFLNDMCWGHADIILLWNNGEIEVVDYKNGFLHVPADCKQLLIYGVAAVRTYGAWAKEPLTTLRTTIIQPNGAEGAPVRTHERSVEDAEHELRKEIVPALNIITHAGDPESDYREPEFVVSEKGCRWCPHGKAGNCDAFNSQALEGVKAHFNDLGALVVPQVEDVKGMTPEQMAQVIEAWPLFKKFYDANMDKALKLAQAGTRIPGYKLVHGRSNRKWAHDSEADTLMFLTKELKLKKAEVTKESLLGPAAVEKLINPKARNGKKKQELLEQAIIKPEGKLTLVKEDNPKKEVVLFETVTEDAGSILA